MFNYFCYLANCRLVTARSDAGIVVVGHPAVVAVHPATVADYSAAVVAHPDAVVEHLSAAADHPEAVAAVHLRTSRARTLLV